MGRLYGGWSANRLCDGKRAHDCTKASSCPRGRPVFLRPPDAERRPVVEAAVFPSRLRTPDSTNVFVTPEAVAQIKADQASCMGCLSQCQFFRMVDAQRITFNRRYADPRSSAFSKSHQTSRMKAIMYNYQMFCARSFPFRRRSLMRTILHRTLNSSSIESRRVLKTKNAPSQSAAF